MIALFISEGSKKQAKNDMLTPEGDHEGRPYEMEAERRTIRESDEGSGLQNTTARGKG